MSRAEPRRRLFAPRRGRHAPTGRGPATAPADPGGQVELWIERLAAGGSVDEGNARVLDRMIDAWREQQLRRIDAYYIDRRRAHEAALLDLQDRLRKAEQRRERAGWAMDRYTAAFGAEAGPEAPGEPAEGMQPPAGRKPGRPRPSGWGPLRVAGPGRDEIGPVAS
ncbi:hypothetical protein [Dactylosporangium salmoneum]|uniref:Uncharacterized protein n=1 Tax=Dactylosporangium salmoneum TaxID=53361 RepID=A0ABN3GRM9_9ACTN